MIYRVVLGVLAVLSLGGLLALTFLPRLLDKKPLKQRRLLMLAIGGIAVISGGTFMIASAFSKVQPTRVADSKQTDGKLSKKDDDTTINGNDQQFPAYELLGTREFKGATRVTIYSTEKNNDKIIRLNDKLIQEYSKKYPGGFFIDYFDDKTVASNYFDKIVNTTTSSENKKQLYNHYKYLMVHINNKKQLYQQGLPSKLIKTYQ